MGTKVNNAKELTWRLDGIVAALKRHFHLVSDDIPA